MYHTYNFYSTILDRVDREGMSQKQWGGFAEIEDLDWICRVNGGTELIRKREEFCLGRPYDDAKTAFKIGDVFIINESFGYHPDRRTTLFIPEGTPAPQITAVFEKYFMKKATQGTAISLPIASPTIFTESFA